MKSRITIEHDFDANLPYLQVRNEDDGDLRDKHVTHFRQRIPFDSNHLYVLFDEVAHSAKDQVSRNFRIYPRNPGIPVCPPSPLQDYLTSIKSGTGTEKGHYFLFESQFDIGEEVEYDYYNGAMTSSNWLSGKVIAVKFTKAKVIYDILDDVTSEPIRGVDSDFVRKHEK